MRATPITAIHRDTIAESDWGWVEFALKGAGQGFTISNAETGRVVEILDTLDERYQLWAHDPGSGNLDVLGWTEEEELAFAFLQGRYL